MATAETGYLFLLRSGLKRAMRNFGETNESAWNNANPTN